MSAETIRFTLPDVSKLEVEYAGCGSHALSVTVEEQIWGYPDSAARQFVRELIKAVRATCPHESTNSNRKSHDGFPLCDHCDARIHMVGVVGGLQDWKWEVA